VSLDQQLFPLINHEWTTPSLDLLMAAMSSFDLWLPFLIVAALLTLLLGGFKARALVLCALLSVAVSDGVVSNSLKKTVNRPRPNQSQAGVRVVTLRKARPQFLALLKPPVVKTSEPERSPSPGRSFPSSHIMNNFAVAMTFACFYRHSSAGRTSSATPMPRKIEISASLGQCEPT
jgi:undecaprenyl-diphosphatase